MNEHRERCETCRFWLRWKDNIADCKIDPEIPKIGQCKRYPPMFCDAGGNDQRPSMQADDWCGEWQQNRPLTPIIRSDWSIRELLFFDQNHIGTLEKLCSYTREELLKMNGGETKYLIDSIELELSTKKLSLRSSC